MNMLSSAFLDLKTSLVRYSLWSHLALSEIRQRYQRSVLGPWWTTLSMLIFILVMSAVFSRLFHQSLGEYIPFFSAGFLFWTLISGCIIESTDVFKNHSGFIKQMNLPYHVYLFKHLSKHLILLGHNFVVYLLVCAFFKVIPSFTWFFLLPGLLLLIANLYWVCLLISLVSTRFRDMVPIVGSAIQTIFFVTPISWTPKLLDNHPALLKLNPLTYLLDIVRSPLLNQYPLLISWEVCLWMAVLGSLVSFFIFARTRHWIVFWVD